MRRVMIALAAVAGALGCGAATPGLAAPPPPVVAAAPTQKAQSFALSRLVVRLRPGEKWGDVTTKPFCAKLLRELNWREGSVELNTADIQAFLYKITREAGFEVPGDDGNLFEDTSSSANLGVAGAVTGMTANVCVREQPRPSTGKITMNMEWQIYSRLDRKVIARIETTASYSTDGDASSVLESAVYGGVARNARELVAQAAFREAIVASAPSAAAVASGPEPRTPLRLVIDKTAKPAGVAGAMNSVVLILAPSGHGSGFLVSKDGYVLTNEHVVKTAQEVRIRWSDGSETRGVVERADKQRDVALIKTDPGTRKPLLFRTVPPVVGETVLAVGAPLDVQFQGTVTRGIVSTPNRMYQGLRYVQSDVMVNHGNSGGPLLDEEGRVVAITDIGYTGGQERSTGINLFVPIDDAARYLNAYQ